MHYHRIAVFLSGCLIMGSLFMIFVATQNFQTADRVLASPPAQAAQMFQTLGEQPSRNLLRYFAGEENQGFFVAWEWAFIAFAIALTAILLFVIRSGLWAGLSGGMLIIALFQHFYVTPQMIAFGRLIDFGAGAGTPAYNQFWRLHGLYGVLEVVKLAMAIAIAAYLLFAPRKTAGGGVEITSEPRATAELHR